MLSYILGHIGQEITWVHNLIEGELALKKRYLGVFDDLSLSPVNMNIRPALVILSSRINGYVSEKTLLLAGVFQYIYIASTIQQCVSRHDMSTSGQRAAAAPASKLPVLAGDYLYGQSLTLLSKEGLQNYIQPIAKILRSIHEGCMIKNMLKQDLSSHMTLTEAIQKESAELFSGCCSLGAGVAGASLAEQEIFKCYGHNFGMAYGLLEEDMKPEYVEPYLQVAKESVARMPDKPERLLLLELLNYISCQRRSNSRKCYREGCV
ncbi:MAG: hypothetical protein GX949_01765 [Peptococcaceae bacterium]|jgi:octaprenyl-diphosphate synthase|nr:hypothetical protein [Peptococcaceae bacterium]